jgi:DNA-binding XRE family transcriptional regulator
MTGLLTLANGLGMGVAKMFLIVSKPHCKNYHIFQSFTRPDTLPYLFRRFRQNHNLTKKALAKKFCVSETYLQQIEDGLKVPSLQISLLYAKEFGLNPEWVKRKWFKDTVEHFSEKLRRKIELQS